MNTIFVIHIHHGKEDWVNTLMDLLDSIFQKGTNFENITPEYIKMIENKLNNRPRKSLNWRTPNEVFYGLEIAA